MAKQSEYGKREVEAAKRVLIELMQMLGEYRESIVLIGGWVPFFTFGSSHTGSTDVDLAIDKDTITDDVYRTIRDNLENHGYREGKQPFIFLKEVVIDKEDPITVQVDFLAGEYGGTGKSHRTQKIQPDVKARKARGCELALQYYTKISVEGVMTDGTPNTVEVKMSEVAPFIAMKGMAMFDTYKEKHTWDVYYCMRNYPGEIDELAGEFKKVLSNKLMQEGLSKIRSKFQSPQDFGPTCVVKFEEITEPEEKERIARDAFERVSRLLDILEIKSFEEWSKG